MAQTYYCGVRKMAMSHELDEYDPLPWCNLQCGMAKT